MKMRELVQRTGMTKEMIHYYAREGMLPDIEKPSPNQATYDEKHAERILLIKKLQQKHFLPIPMIKKIIEQGDESLLDEQLLEIKSEYFESPDHLLLREIRGEEAFLAYSGMSPERLADFEEYQIITFQEINGEKIYSHDAIKLGKLIGDMRRRGLSHENGFSRTALKEVRDAMIPVLELLRSQFLEGLGENQFSEKETRRLAVTAMELTPLFLYHLTHIFLEELLTDFLGSNEAPTNHRT